jgi:ATP synthase protein I
MRGGGIVLRVGIELAGTLAVGVAIGWGLDKWLGTGPWLLVVFFFLGAAGGVLNVYRAVGNMGLAAGYRKPDSSSNDPDSPDSKE